MIISSRLKLGICDVVLASAFSIIGMAAKSTMLLTECYKLIEGSILMV